MATAFTWQVTMMSLMSPSNATLLTMFCTLREWQQWSCLYS